MIDIDLLQLREIQEDAIRLQAKALVSVGLLEGEAIDVVLHHLDHAMHKLEQYQVAPLLVRMGKPVRN